MSTEIRVPQGRLAWLGEQVEQWQAEGLLDVEQGAAILARYRATRSFTVGRLLLGLGAVFVGVGAIWLVASNLDQLSPLLRFAAVATLWLGALVGAEVLAERGAPSVVVGAVRLLAAFGTGAVVFQAAQSLQVPAYEPKLVGLWGAGALVHAYALRARGPLLVGVAAATVWSVWQGVWPTAGFSDVVLVLTLSAVLALAVAALHARWLPDFAAPWRHVGVALLLVGLFAAGIPVSEGWEVTWSWWPVLLGVLTAGAVVAAAATAPATARWEVLGGVAALAVGLVLTAWPAGGDVDSVAAQDWAHAVLGVVAYVAVAVGIAVVGTLRDSWPLTAMATAGLVVFTTFQSFAVFAPIIQGATLFLVLGVVFLATGLGFDRARRRLARSLDEPGSLEEGAAG